MQKSENERNELIDSLLMKINKNFHSFLLAKTILQFGEINFDTIDEDADIQFAISSTESIEPIPIAELKQYSDFFPTFLVEVFHGKEVVLWQELLTNVFSLYIDLHFDGKRKFKELTTQKIRFDFRCEEDVICHVKKILVKDFTFETYEERQRIISKICNPQNTNTNYCNALYEIHKNVIIRNSFQHKDSILTNDSLIKLGKQTIEVLDIEGNILSLCVGNKITLSPQEFYRFHQSLILIGQMWKNQI